MNERIIQQQVYSLFQNYDYKLCNVFMFAWESDFFAISKSGYSVEVEVKISRSDFKADEKKIAKHHLLNHHKTLVIVERRYPFEPYIHYKDRQAGVVYDPDTWEYRLGDHSTIFFCFPAESIPNKFYYAVPEGLIKIDEVPKWAGLIYIKTHSIPNEMQPYKPHISYTYYVAKQAPFLHRNVRKWHVELLSKYYFKHYDIKNAVFDFIYSIQHDMTDYQKECARVLKSKFY